MNARTSARTIALIAFWLLFALQWAWHGWLSPPVTLSPLVPLLFFAVPLLLPAIGLLRRRPDSLFWAAVISLLHFCHGISEWWTDPSVTALAAGETVLALLLIGAVGHDGLQRRRRAKAT